MEIVIKNIIPAMASKKVPIEKVISLVKFQKVLSRLNREATANNNIQIEFHFLTDENGSTVGDEIVLNGQTFKLTDHLDMRLQETMVQDPNKYLQLVKISKHLQITPTEVTITKIVTSSKKNEKLKPKKTKLAIHLSVKMLRLVVGGTLTLLLVVFFYAFFFTSEAPKTPSYSLLIEEKKYVEAAKYFPKKHREIEEQIIENNDLKQLKKYNELYPTPEGDFDLSFYNKEWEKVVQSDLDTLSENRKVMVAHAFIMLDRVEEAEIFNRKLKSEKLTEEIQVAYLRRAIGFLQKADIHSAKEIQKKLSNHELDSMIGDAQIYIEMIEYNKNDMDKKGHWQKKLQNIGKEFLENAEN